MKSHITRLSAAGLAVMLATAAAPSLAATTYSAEALPHINGGSYSAGLAISATGVVAGESSGFGDHAVLWATDGSVVSLATSSESTPQAVDVNRFGQAAVNFDFLPYVWSNGALMPISIAGWAPTLVSINDAGAVAGTFLSSTLPLYSYRAFSWINGVTTELGTLPGGGDSAAKAINNSGQVVGSAKNSSGLMRAVLWNNGVIQDLGTLPGDTQSVANQINDAGQVFGISYSATSTHAFIWENGVMSVATSAVPNLNAVLGRSSCYAKDINDAGQVAANCGEQAFRLTPVAPGVDVGVQMSSTSIVVAQGSPVRYTLTVSNAGSLAASAVRVSDVLPAGATLVSASASQGVCSGVTTLVCDLGDLAIGGEASIEITLTPSIIGTLTNTATVAANEVDPNRVNDSASVNVTVKAPQDTADLSVSMSANPNPAVVGANLTYTMTVNNVGAGTANSVILYDTVPAGVSFVTATSTQGACTGITFVTCSLGSIAGGASATISLVVRPNSAAVYKNSATVYTTTTDVNATNNSANLSVTANASLAAADMAITMTGSPSITRVGSLVTYTMKVSNKGPQTGTDVLVTDTVSPFVSYVSLSTSQGSCTATAVEVLDSIASTFSRPTTRVTCSLGSVANGAGATVKIVVRMNLAATISNTAAVSASSYDASQANNYATVSTRVR